MASRIERLGLHCRCWRWLDRWSEGDLGFRRWRIVWRRRLCRFRCWGSAGALLQLRDAALGERRVNTFRMLAKERLEDLQVAGAFAHDRLPRLLSSVRTADRRGLLFRRVILRAAKRIETKAWRAGPRQDLGILRATRVAGDVARRKIEQIAEIAMRLGLKARQQRLGEGRMRTGIAVGGELAREGGIGDEQRAAFRSHTENPRKPPPPDPIERAGHCGKGSLRQASSRTICCGAPDTASNNCSRSMARLGTFLSQSISISTGASTFLPRTSSPWPA